MMRIQIQSWIVSWAAVSMIFVSIGCGGGDPMPELAEVTGVVTLDGNPLSGVTVTFFPKTDNFGAATGQTDAQGRYQLKYKGEIDGAPVGSHTVRIAQENQAEIPTEEWLPDKYNQQSTLTADVKAGETNEANFDLTSN